MLALKWSAESLKKQQRTLQRAFARCAFMKDHHFQYPIAVMSDVLCVSRSGYYVWLSRKPSVRTQCDEILEAHVKVTNEAARHTYGEERVHAELEKNGVLTKYAHYVKGLGCSAGRRNATNALARAITVKPLRLTCWSRTLQ